jgi:hypothetical protein
MPPIETLRDRFFYSDSYALGYMILSECSAEPQQIAAIVEQQWQMLDHDSRHTLLDVGAADGRITALLSKGFEHVAAYEPNDVLYALLVGRFWGRREFSSFHRTWNAREHVSSSVSHIMISHVLYHIPQSKWGEIISRIGSSDNPGQRRCVTLVLWNEAAQAYRFCSSVNPKRWHVTADDLSETLRQLSERIPDIKVTVHRLDPIIRVPTPGAADAVATFLLGRKHAESIRGVKHRKQLVQILLGQGLNNSQSIFSVSFP